MDAVAERKGEGGWHGMTSQSLLSSVDKHLEKLWAARARLLVRSRSEEEKAALRNEIAHEAVDTAAYLMMIVDNVALGRALVKDE